MFSVIYRTFIRGGRSYLSAEKQLVYSTAPVDWAKDFGITMMKYSTDLRSQEQEHHHQTTFNVILRSYPFGVCVLIFLLLIQSDNSKAKTRFFIYLVYEWQIYPPVIPKEDSSRILYKNFKALNIPNIQHYCIY